MKKIIIAIIVAVATLVTVAAQSTNPLNYSGRMYVEAIEIIATPRYVSYEDHTILSQKPYVAEESEAPRDMLMGLGMI